MISNVFGLIIAWFEELPSWTAPVQVILSCLIQAQMKIALWLETIAMWDLREVNFITIFPTIDWSKLKTFLSNSLAEMLQKQFVYDFSYIF